MSTIEGQRRGHVSLGSALLRRGWLLVVCAIAVGALAYGIAQLQSATYSSEAVLNVPSALGPSSPGSAQGAAELARSYARSIPDDDRLARAADRASGSSGSVDTTRRGSILTVGYAASSSTAAVKGARALATALTGQRPTGSGVASGTLDLLRGPHDATLAVTGRYRATAQLLVPAGAGPTQVSADNANKLATTYAGVLASDDGVAAAAARAVGSNVDGVRSSLSVVNEKDTSLLRVSYKDSSARRAADGARAIAHAVTGQHPASTSILPGSLDIVSLPKTATTTGTVNNARSAIPVGVVLGLVLGLVLLIAWERSDPHVTRAPDLSRQIGCPATPVDRLSDDAAYALLERWASLSGERPARVAILPANGSVEPAADEIVDFLLEAGRGHVAFEDRRLPSYYNGDGGHAEQPDHELVLVRAAPPGGASGGEAVALDADLTVVVIPKAMKAAGVRVLSEDLSDFGVQPAWALLTARRPGLGTRPRVAQGETAAIR